MRRSNVTEHFDDVRIRYANSLWIHTEHIEIQEMRDPFDIMVESNPDAVQLIPPRPTRYTVYLHTRGHAWYEAETLGELDIVQIINKPTLVVFTAMFGNHPATFAVLADTVTTKDSAIRSVNDYDPYNALGSRRPLPRP